MSKTDSKLTVGRLRQLLTYDPETGVFTNNVTRSSNSIVGEEAGGPVFYADGQHVWRIGIDRRVYAAHRLAIFYMTGKWPALMVSHKDDDGLNNRYRNLQHISVAEGQHLRKGAQITSTTGIVGVYPKPNPTGKRKKLFFSHIRVNGVRKYLGCFHTAEQASQSYQAAKRKYHALPRP